MSEWLNSGEYQSELTNLVATIVASSNCSNTESTTSSIFENNLYSIIKEKVGITIEFQKEVSVSGIQDERHNFATLNGRLDAMVNNLLIEYKHKSKLNKDSDIENAYKQVTQYLVALKKNKQIEYSAILTDGITIAYFSFSEGQVHHSALSPLGNKDMDIIIRAILNNETKKFVPQNILKDFNISLHSLSSSKILACCLHRSLVEQPTAKTQMLYEEWKSLMHLSIDDVGKGNDIQKRRNDLSLIFDCDMNDNDDEYKALYALQTTYSVIVKLIACKIADKLTFNQDTRYYSDLTTVSSNKIQSFLEIMENGYSYRNQNLTNFLEGDFFSWYTDAEQWTVDFANSVKEIIRKIDEYSSFSFNIRYDPIDIFKDLYMSIIPSSVRHSTGEYFTPNWLASHVVEQSVGLIDNPNWKAIDPCCGSGIFIIALIKHILKDKNPYNLSNEEKQSLKKDILDRVYGVDINPLSVLSARVGYFLALLPLGNMSHLEIPIYLGDSAIIPTTQMIDDIPCYTHNISNSKKSFTIVLPKRFVADPDFGKVMSELQVYVDIQDSFVLYNAIYEKLNNEERNSKNLKSKINELAENLVELRKNNWDGIWIRIIANFMYIARLGDFDIIVGNPPWVKWEHLPSAYAEKIKNLCNIKHIFSGQGRFGGTQLNICALIANVTATNWLNQNGILAFLMPDSIMSQNSYEGFRHFFIDYEKKIRLYLQKLDKWEAPLRPFSSGTSVVSQDFNTYYFGYKEMDYYQGIPVKVISKKSKISNTHINEQDSMEMLREYMTFSDTVAMQLSEQSSVFSYQSEMFDYSMIMGDSAYLYRTGVEFTPQELFMLVGFDHSDKAGCYRFKNMIFKRSKYKVTDTPVDGWEFPTDSIYPIVTGPNMSKFSFNTNNQFCILPYDKNDTTQAIPVEILLKTQPELFLYLSSHINMINQQSEKSKQMRRGKEFYALSKLGPYTFADHIVAAKDNGKFCASVISPCATPWGSNIMPICVKHTIVISQRKKDKSFINEMESHFICGILNSDIIRTYLKENCKSNGISLNKSRIYLPLFDPSNANHIKISELAQNAQSVSDETEIDNICLELSNLYMEICKSRGL